MFLTRVTEFKDETQGKMACIRNSHRRDAAWHYIPCDLSQKVGPLETRKVGPLETRKVRPLKRFTSNSLSFLPLKCQDSISIRSAEDCQT